MRNFRLAYLDFFCQTHTINFSMKRNKFYENQAMKLDNFGLLILFESSVNSQKALNMGFCAA